MDSDQFYFNEWAFMARTDPESFERRRAQYISQWLATTGKHRPSLEALQMKIDCERERAGSPQQAVAAITQMMHESLRELASGLKGLSDDLRTLESGNAPYGSAPPAATARRPADQAACA